MNRILALSPWIEVFVRNVFWRFKGAQKFLKFFLNKINKSALTQEDHQKINFDLILEEITNFGISPGDILIVHSGNEFISRTGLPPKLLVTMLKNIVGEQGTLAMPAIPAFAKEPRGAERFVKADIDETFVYNVKKTRAWTGILPMALLELEGSIRSRHPLSTMAAIGANAQEMMANNISGSLPRGSGPQSSWKFCADRNAKIVSIGVDLLENLTMIHVAEDCHKHWPINDWNRTRTFRVVDGEFDEIIKVEERHPYWAMYYAERTLERELNKEGLIQKKMCQGVKLECIESGALLRFLESKNKSGYPYYTLKALL